MADFADSFPAERIHRITSGTVTGSGLVGKAIGVLKLAKGVIQCRSLVNRIQPMAAVGFGGYPTVPPVLAASILGIPASCMSRTR